MEAAAGLTHGGRGSWKIMKGEEAQVTGERSGVRQARVIW